MNKLLSIIFLTLLLYGCNSRTSEQKAFIELLNKGYKANSKEYTPMILGFHLDRNISCVYGEKPEPHVKSRINLLYKLITTEFNELSMPLFVNNLNECPKETSIFIFLYHTLKNPTEEIFQNNTNIYKFLDKNITAKREKQIGMGNVIRLKHTNGKVAVAVNQFTELQKLDKLYLATSHVTAIEELYQAISSGYDITTHNEKKSMLEEPCGEHEIGIKAPETYSIDNIGKNQYGEYFKKINKAKVNGLCTFDLWFLILADMAKEQNIQWYDDHIKLFDKNFDSIKNRAITIENNSDYKELFDPRCSGKFAGEKSMVRIIPF